MNALAVPLYSSQQNASLLQEAIRRPWWLKVLTDSSFQADFKAEGCVDISFDIRLGNGILLSSPAAATLRGGIIDFLCLQAAPGLHGVRSMAPKTERRHFISACRVVDGLLVKDRLGKLAQHGLSSVTAGDLISVLVAACTHQRANPGIYDWPRRLPTWMRANLASVTEDEIRSWTTRFPRIGQLPSSDERRIFDDDDELLKSRVLILKLAEQQFGPYRVFNQQKESAVLQHVKEALYQDTLLGRAAITGELVWPPELRMADDRTNRQELKAVPVSVALEDNASAKKTDSRFRKSMLTARALAPFGNCFPTAALSTIETVDISEEVRLKDPKGFRHVPPHIVAACLTNAIDFFYTSGPYIFGAVEDTLCRSGGIHDFDAGRISDHLKNLGVAQWAIGPDLYGSAYAPALRTSPGLWDLTLVLYGACALIVGVMEALRKGEMDDIRKQDVNAEKLYLAVFSRKSGHGDLRRIDELPIPQVAADVLTGLTDFVNSVDSNHELLFAPLGKTGKFRNGGSTLEDAVDAFLDYFEAPTDKLGRRYYLRQHQLRKFFVEVFFKCAGFAGIDTLRWFLRHFDMAHLWAYIKLNTSKEELRDHMSSAAAPLIRSGDSHMEPLIKFLRERYAVSDFSTLPDDEFHELLNDLQADRTVEFDMVFPDGSDSNNFHLGVIVWQAK